MLQWSIILPSQPIHAELIAVVVAVRNGQPRVLTLHDGSALPAGPLESGHASLQAGLRNWVERQTGRQLGLVEQLYTFADPGRSRNGRSISISYLALTSEHQTRLDGPVSWQDWYRFFPWEDRRTNPPPESTDLTRRLQAWAAGSGERQARVAHCFGLDGVPWADDLALPRYELLHEAGQVQEAGNENRPLPVEITGRPMLADHRRILATAISRLRAKIIDRPVVFELLPEPFTLLDLQRCVEAIAGRSLHKQNFRRLIEAQALLEDTATHSHGTGRPARLYRFRAAARAARAMAGTRLPLTRP